MKLKYFSEIKSERLLLRKIEESDWEVVLFLRSDKTITKFIERPENRKTKNKSISWGITIKTNPQIIGTICLWNFSKDNKIAEVGYDLKLEFQGNGIMSEALNCIINFGFNELKLDKIEAFTHTKNENSKRLLEKCEFLLNEDRKDRENDSNVIFELKRL